MKKNNLDEMQDRKLLKLEEYGFWIMFWALAAAIVIQLATGAIGVARALEARKNKSSWKLRMTAGMISLATVLLGLIFFRQPDAVVDIYCIGLLFSAIEHFITAFRRNKIVTIA